VDPDELLTPNDCPAFPPKLTKPPEAFVDQDDVDRLVLIDVGATVYGVPLIAVVPKLCW
jgi:hypothetical protein